MGGDVHRMAASLEQTVGELQLAQDQQRAFVADVSHELRTPMTALVQEAALLHDHLDALPADGRRGGELLVRDVARLRTLVDDLMEISRFDAAAEVAAPTEFDVAAFVRAVVAERLPGARLDVPAARPRRPRPAASRTDPRQPARQRPRARRGDRGRDRAGRGRRHAPPDRCRPRPGRPAGGIAAPVRALPQGRSVAEPGGSGLGLAIAREHAELLGGTLDATLRDGGGLRFELHLPVTRPLPGGDEPVTGEVEA